MDDGLLHLLAIDENAVGGLVVLDKKLGPAGPDGGMLSRDGRVRQNEVRLGRAANDAVPPVEDTLPVRFSFAESHYDVLLHCHLHPE